MSAPAEAINLMEALSRQIERVATIRERYRCLSDMRGANFRPAIYLMDVALETAHTAAASGDALTIARSLQCLGQFEDLPGRKQNCHGY